ncbi:MAG: CRTAC1 family protein, partial [bacterium]|nr:CRTAC1 family protein [bacterium]
MSFSDKVVRRKRILFGLLVTAVVGVSAVWLTMTYFGRDGLRFFNTGKEIVLTLRRMAEAVENRDLDAVAGFYSPSFQGRRLGFTDLEPAEDRDGVEIYRFRPGGPATDRQAAVDEWQAYLEGFDDLEEVGLHVHRLHEWKGPVVLATVRFELIGTPRGAPRAGIDRAFFRIRFERTGEGPRIVEAALTEEPPVANHVFGGDRVISATPHFVNVAAAAGMDFKHRYYPPFIEENRDQRLMFAMLLYGPGGISAADYDNDGFYDLFIPDGIESRLFRNRGDGTFEDVTAAAGLAGLDGVSVGLLADYDNDGHKDLFVSRTFTPNQLYHNNGDGTFTDVTAGSGIGEDCCTTVGSWADYDNDGLLDLYVGRYLDPRPHLPTTFYARNGEPNQLYRNNGDGSFTNVTEETGVGEVGLCLGSVFVDYDDDGDADLYVVNDFGRKTLYRNEGPEEGYTFTDVTVESGTLAYGAGMSAAAGDFDNDGWFDFYVAQIRSEHAWFAERPTVMRHGVNTWRQGVWPTDMPLYLELWWQSGGDYVKVFQDMASGNTLLHNRGADADGQVTFEDVSWAADANPPGWFWGSGFADFDNDGWLDIYATNGWVYNDVGTEIELDFLNSVVSEMKEYKAGTLFDPKYFGNFSWHGWERNSHLRNNGDGTFKEIGRATGSDILTNSRGVAVADFWNRGVLDIAVSGNADRHALLRNEVGRRRNWLAVEVVGAGSTLPNGSNRDGVGTRVVVRHGDHRQIREVTLGDGYGSQNSLRLYFGLGELEEVDELSVRWLRSGIEQRFSRVAANRIVEVTEGRDQLVEKDYGTKES